VTSLARRERDALCDLALQVGPDAPTLCDGWDVRGLLSHLHVREHAPYTALGELSARFRPLRQRATDRRRAWPFRVLVDQVRRPAILLRAIPRLDAAFNGAEYFVHHEDIRRGQPDWAPRRLDDATRAEVWKAACQMGIFVGRKLPVPVVIADGEGRTHTVKKGPSPVTVTGEPAELVLYLTGRSAHLPLAFDGPPDSVAALESAARRV